MPTQSPLPDFILQRRLRDLEDNICKDLALLKDFEEELLYTTDPRQKARYQREIQGLRESADRYTREYQELLPEPAQPFVEERQSVAGQLTALSAQLNRVQEQLDGISSDISGLRKEVLARFDSGEQAVLSAILAKLDENQIQTVNWTLAAIEEDRLLRQEAEQLIAPLYAALANLQ